jgi:hypothetical protein
MNNNARRKTVIHLRQTEHVWKLYPHFLFVKNWLTVVLQRKPTFQNLYTDRDRLGTTWRRWPIIITDRCNQVVCDTSRFRESISLITYMRNVSKFYIMGRNNCTTGLCSPISSPSLPFKGRSGQSNLFEDWNVIFCSIGTDYRLDDRGAGSSSPNRVKNFIFSLLSNGHWELFPRGWSVRGREAGH